MSKFITRLSSSWLLIAATAPTAVSAEQGQLLWSDDFQQNGNMPNPSYWSHDTGNGGWGNGELQTYSDSTSNCVVQDGVLKIIAQKDDSSSPPTFTSARIKTQDKVSFKYGRLEARIHNPNVDAGLWPAFWTMGANVDSVGWPKSGEVDIMELGQGLAIEAGLVNRRVVSAAHWDYQGNYATYANYFDAPANLTNGFHIYALEWTPDKMTTLVDGNVVWSMNIDSVSCEDCEELHQPHFILLNMAIGGGFTSGGSSSSSAGGSSSSGCGSSSATAMGTSSSSGCSTRGPDDITAPFPAEMIVDWVRLYDNGHTEVDMPSTPQPTTATVNAQTKPPTKAPTTPQPYIRPTAAPVVQPTPPPVTVATPPPVARSSRRPTARPTRRPTARPTPRPTAAYSRSGPAFSDDVGDDDDCFYSSGSRSSGKAGKGGKGGKSGSRSTSSRAYSGKGGKGGKGGRRLTNTGRSSGKGGSSSKSKSGSRSARSGCRAAGEGRVGQSSFLAHDSSSGYRMGQGSALLSALLGLALAGFIRYW